MDMNGSLYKTMSLLGVIAIITVSITLVVILPKADEINIDRVWSDFTVTDEGRMAIATILDDGTFVECNGDPDLCAEMREEAEKAKTNSASSR